MRDQDEIVIISNNLEQPYAALYHAAHAGSDLDVLAALREMADVCPDVIGWLAKEVGRTEPIIREALDLFGEPMTFEDWGPTDIEVQDLEQTLDDAAMFGTLEETLDHLCREDPRAATTICRHYGLRGQTEATLGEIGSEWGVTGESARKYAKRGRDKIKKRMEAQGKMP